MVKISTKKDLDAGKLTTDVKSYRERCESMADWIKVTLSPETAKAMLKWFKWGCNNAQKDVTGDFGLCLI